MNGLNAVVIDGKCYESVIKKNGNPCIDCELLDDICNNCGLMDFCLGMGGQNSFFRFSQSLTDKLNKQ